MSFMISLGQRIEIRSPAIERGKIRHAIFDFDGTLSLVREGWQQVMIPMMVDLLADLGTGESREELAGIIREYTTRLTGKQTIYQMFELSEQIRKRGGTPLDPLEYKHEYLRRLESRISGRIAGLEDGSVAPESLLVPGSRSLLEDLAARGVRMYLASGTDEPFVLREARLLDVDRYFEGRIYGALDNFKDFSKKMVIDRILTEHGLTGPELLGIGDGYVEIENTKEVGGIALACATLEADPGDFDLWKKERLIRAGADILVPDFRESRELLEYLFP